MSIIFKKAPLFLACALALPTTAAFSSAAFAEDFDRSEINTREKFDAYVKERRAAFQAEREERIAAIRERRAAGLPAFEEMPEEEDSEPALESNSVETTGSGIEATLFAQCGSGEFQVGFEVPEGTNCTLNKTITINGEATVLEEQLVGSMSKGIELPLGSVASVNMALSCTNADGGTFGGSAQASTQQGCTIPLNMSDDATDADIAERMQGSLDAVLEHVEKKVAKTKEKIAMAAEEGKDTGRYAEMVTRSLESTIEAKANLTTRMYQDKISAEVVDQAVADFNMKAAALIASLN